MNKILILILLIISSFSCTKINDEMVTIKIVGKGTYSISSPEIIYEGVKNNNEYIDTTVISKTKDIFNVKIKGEDMYVYIKGSANVLFGTVESFNNKPVEENVKIIHAHGFL